MWLIELMMCTNWNLITASSWPIVHVATWQKVTWEYNMAIEDLVSHSKLGSGSSQHGSVDQQMFQRWFSIRWSFHEQARSQTFEKADFQEVMNSIYYEGIL